MKMNRRPRSISYLPRMLVTLGCALTMTGCSILGKQADDGPVYETSRQAQTNPLELPPDLAAPGMDRAFRIPDTPGSRVSARDLDREQPASTQRRTGTLEVLPETAQVQLRRDGTTRWLTVDFTPEELWPRLREFWRAQNLTLARDEPVVGIMETEWAENRAGIPLNMSQGLISRALGSIYDAGTRDQYRTRVERHDGATEVFISHRGAVEHGDEEGMGARWVIGEPDPEMEAEMLNRLLVFLTTGETTASTARAEETEADFERTGRVDLVERDGRQVLVLWGEPDALWRRLGLALDRTGLLVDEQNRRTGTFLVTYRTGGVDDVQERRGFLSRMFSFGRKTSRYENERFQIRMLEDGRDLQVIALSVDGEPLSKRDERFVLETIQPQLR